jgi:hypothetical protein
VSPEPEIFVQEGNSSPTSRTLPVPHYLKILLANSETSYVAQDSILVLNATSPNSQLRKLGYSQFANSII